MQLDEALRGLLSYSVFKVFSGPPWQNIGASLRLSVYIITTNKMNESELKEKTYESVIKLAVSLTQQGKTMTSDELNDWINKNHAGFQHPYGNSRGMPQAAFRRAKEANNQEGMDALVKAFTHNDGTPLWQE